MCNVIQKANAVGYEYSLESLALELNEVKCELSTRNRNLDELIVERQGLDIDELKRQGLDIDELKRKLELLQFENESLESRLTGIRTFISTVGNVFLDIVIIVVLVSVLLIVLY